MLVKFDSNIVHFSIIDYTLREDDIPGIMQGAIFNWTILRNDNKDIISIHSAATLIHAFDLKQLKILVQSQYATDNNTDLHSNIKSDNTRKLVSEALLLSIDDLKNGLLKSAINTIFTEIPFPSFPSDFYHLVDSLYVHQ